MSSQSLSLSPMCQVWNFSPSQVRSTPDRITSVLITEDHSVNDVPGYKPHNNDSLAMGCWAEADAGQSLILVESVENKEVVFSVFDLTKNPVVEYRDKMFQATFETEFSWDPSAVKKTPADIKWTWHDKTPFPWNSVIKSGASDGYRPASVGAMIDQLADVADSMSHVGQKSAAGRVAEALRMRGAALNKRRATSMSDRFETGRSIAVAIKNRIGAGLRNLGERISDADD